MIIMNKKGQVSLEVVILIGILIVIAIIVAVILFDYSNKSIDSTTETIDGNVDIVDNFIKDYNQSLELIYIPHEKVHSSSIFP